MGDTIGPVASAVIVPESITLDTRISPPSKRRQSISPSPSSPSSKRPRLIHYESIEASARSKSPSTLPAQSPDVPTETAEVEQPKADRRKSHALEERKRGQRLFGGLLSTLSQTTPVGQQKRRQEIEKRQAERVKLQKHDEEVKEKEVLGKLRDIRKAEQGKFDEQSMRIRHQNELAMAHSLQTDTQPRLYYKPWGLLPSQERRIKTQISTTEAAIKREAEDWEQQHSELISRKTDQAKTELSADMEKGEGNSEREKKGEQPQPDHIEPSLPLSPSASTSNPKAPDTTNPDPNIQVEEVMPIVTNEDPGTQASRDEQEHNGEVVLEAEEDTVIY